MTNLKSRFSYLGILFSFTSQILLSQTFTDPGITFATVNQGSVAWGDYDNDGDLDVLATGYVTSGSVTKIYNNAGGVFTDINANLIGIYQGTASWGDYDNDGDLDILLTGNFTSIIYRNDGGSFLDIGAGLPNVNYSSSVWGDYDNDGDLDILLTGITASGERLSRIYRNDNGIFYDTYSGLTGVSQGSVAWGDYDNDNDLDILLTGLTVSNERISKIYRNSNGVFTDINAGLYGAYVSSVSWGDYDNDGDLDILIAGAGSSLTLTRIYRNDNGLFTDIAAGLGNSTQGSVTWGDFDNDGDLDFLSTGGGASLLYANDNGVFNVTANSFVNASYSSVAWGDFDKDGDLDILLTGSGTSKIYLNNTVTPNTIPSAPSNLQASIGGNGITFTWNKATDTQTGQNGLSYNLFIGTSPTAVNKRSPMAIVSGGYRKIAAKGVVQSNSWTIKKLPAGTYYWSVQAIDNSFAGSAFSTPVSFVVPFSNSIAPVANQTLKINQTGSALTVTESATSISRQWKYSTTNGGPYNQVITSATGTTYSPVFSVLGIYYVVCESTYGGITYTSNQVKIIVTAFIEQNINLSSVQYSSVAWGDYDNDDDLDILLTGYDIGGNWLSKIYRNDLGVFNDINAGLVDCGGGAVWGDFDNDNDLDIVLPRLSGSTIYRNNNGIFNDINAGLIGVDGGSAAWGDYDNDGDLDILLTGYGINSSGVSKIYRNDNGTFIDINAGLIDVSSSSVAWGDYDNDGDLDILLTGSGVSKIYRNDNGVFTDIVAGLFGVSAGSVAWGDYDSDGDLDVLLTGSGSSTIVTKIFKNNNGVFSEISTSLPGVMNSSVGWGDYDNDGDLDILLSGLSSSGKITNIYQNNSGVFTESSSGLTGISYGSVAWGNYDGDGDLDILITGSGSNDLVSKIYKNNTIAQNAVPSSPSNLQTTGTANKVTLTWDKSTDTKTLQIGLSYNLYIGTTPAHLNRKSPMATLPGGFRKIVQKGVQTNTWTIKNLPSGTYYWSVQAIDNSFAGSAFATESSFSVAYANSVSPIASQTLKINQAGVVLTVTESTPANSRQWKYSTVNGGPYTVDISGATSVTYTPNFTAWGTYYVVCESIKDAVAFTSNEVKINVPLFSEQTGIDGSSGGDLIGIYYGSARWGDYDNDGDLDFLLTGGSTNFGSIARIYQNSSGIFTDINAGLAGAMTGTGEWCDYDNDGDLDVLLAGTGPTRIYRNDGGIFTLNITLPSIPSGSAAWGDYDNDGDLDLLLSGSYSSKIFRNDNGVFVDIKAVLVGILSGSVAWGDYDNDGDLDILLTGQSNNGNVSVIYRNDGGTFTDILAGLSGVTNSSVAWGDYDSDGDLDILLTGSSTTGAISKIYRNDNGSFPDINAGLTGVQASSVAWGDYDNDGDLDILLTGSSALGEKISRIYQNDAGFFTDINAGLQGITRSSVTWGDYDKDGDLDILMGGQRSSGYSTTLYRNNITSANTVPGAPTNLQSVLGSNKVTLSWNKSTDAKTPVNGLSYNIYLGSVTPYLNKRSPMAGIPGGYRRIVKEGAFQKNGWVIKNLPAGTYYWSVQAIDNSFAGSVFPTEVSFTVPFSNSISPVVKQILLINQNGSPLTVTESGAPTSHQWKYSVVSGGPYSQTITGATQTSYTPNFPSSGVYYVVCESIFNAVTYTSNEVEISVPVFTEYTLSSLVSVRYSSVAWGDYDNNGTLDVLLTGNSNSKVYNNSSGVFSSITSTLTPVNYSSAAWGDFDNDGDLDILLAGYSGTGDITKIYRNDAGVFTDIHAGLAGTEYGSASWGDYDNDGDLDILLSGTNFSKIYRNDNGVFTDINAGLTGVSFSSSAWGDYDNDGDLDILLTGLSGADPISKIYRNDNGVFTDINAGLFGLYYSSVAWGDFDNDGDLDILMSGFNTIPVSVIYRNDGGIFNDQNAGLTGVYRSSVAWGDYDNDGDLDVLLSGNSQSESITKIYRNTAGVFAESNRTGLSDAGVQYSSVAWGDYDRDGDLDLLLTGSGNSSTISKIFRNNTLTLNIVPSAPTNLQASLSANKVTLSWNKSTDANTPQDGLSYNLYIGTSAGSINRQSPMASLTDGLRKVVQRGMQSNTRSVKNLPAGTYYWGVQAVDIAFAGSLFSSEGSFIVAYSNSIGPVADQALAINQNGSQLSVNESTPANSRQWKYSTVSGGPYIQIITGATGTTFTPLFSALGNYYVVCVSTKDAVTYTSNEVRINLSLFMEQTNIILTGVRSSSVKWGDYDNDSDLDILVSGYTPTGYISKIYRNDSGVFNDINAGLIGIQTCSAAWGDYDNDGELDVLLTGVTSSGNITKIYRNEGGVFTDISAGFPGIYGSYGSVDWGDYDDDGDLDILIAGSLNTSSFVSRVYRNDNGVFTDIDAGLSGVQYPSVAWGDYDNDGDKDILLTGSTLASGNISKIYRNVNGVFTDINAGLTGLSNGSIAWGDYDNDGDLDILLTGITNPTGGDKLSIIYRNDKGIFTDITAGLPGVNTGSAAWADYDNDGDLDILLSGSGILSPFSRIYRNVNGIFSDINADLPGVYASSVAWGDYDNDGKVDILLSGSDAGGTLTKVFKNTNLLANTSPVAPTSLQSASTSTSEVTLSWNKATDLQTPQNSLTYNIRIGTTAGNSNVVGPMSSASSGYRRLPARGNAEFKNNGYVIANLTPGTSYYWSVQAIDQAYAGGAWATESSFTLLEAPVAGNATNITVTSLLANWSASAGASGYRIDVASDNAFTAFVTGYNNKDVGNVTNATVSGLLPNTAYYYRIKAYEAGGISIINSNIITATTLNIPSIPTGIAATAIQQTSFNANWISSSTATGYRLDVASDIGFTTILTGFNNLDVGSVTIYPISGLTSKTVYYYRVRAYNVGGTSGNSNIITVTTLPYPPATPTGLSAISCNNSVTLSWTASTETDFLRYRIYSGATAIPTTKIDSTTTTTKTISGLTNGQTYYFRVTTVIAPGVESPFGSSASVKVKTGVIPKIKSKWNDLLISYNSADSLTAFQWYKGATAISGATLQYYISNRAPGSYYVIATDKEGCKNTSNIINLSGAKSLSVYPNPASTTFVLNLSSETLGETIVNFYNSSGIRVMEYNTRKTDSDLSREIPVSTLQNGLYSIEVIVNNKEVDYTRLVIIK